MITDICCFRQFLSLYILLSFPGVEDGEERRKGVPRLEGLGILRSKGASIIFGLEPRNAATVRNFETERPWLSRRMKSFSAI